MKFINFQVWQVFIMVTIVISLTAANNSVRINENNNPSKQESTGQPIRITTDMSFCQKSLNQEQFKYLEKLIQITTSFFAKLIKITPLKINKYTDPDDVCKENDIKIPRRDRQNGVPNSDLHIYITTRNIGDKTVAQSDICYKEKSSPKKRSTFGIIFINTEVFFSNPGKKVSFQYNLQTLIHEILHILGFMDMRQYNNNKIDQSSSRNNNNNNNNLQPGQNKFVVSSNNVLRAMQKYYKSNDVRGMPITSGGGHWDQGPFVYEIMRMSPFKDHFGIINLSIFTIALLKDTGYYQSINENFISPTFLEDKINDLKLNYPFTNKVFNLNKADSLTCTSYGYVSERNNYEFKSNTNYITYPEACSEYFKFYDISRIQFSPNEKEQTTKCFVSNLINPKIQKTSEQLPNIRCHQYECSADQTQITIMFESLDNLKFVCSSEKKGKTFNVNYKNQSIGTLECPRSYTKFCFTPFCKNGCSENGFCLGGKCYCNAGYSAEDCSKKCDLFENNKCVSACSKNRYANPDNTCKAICPKGYFKSQGKCIPCDFSCSQCIGPSKSQCTACQLVTYLKNRQCVEDCGNGFIQDNKKKTCEKCPLIGCEKCLNKNSCRKCLPGYNWIKNKCFLKGK